MEAKERARRLYCLVVMFFIVSLIGWLLETVNFIVIGSPMDRGYLTLPLCTVYGCALLAVYFAVGTPTKGRLRPLFERCRALSCSESLCAHRPDPALLCHRHGALLGRGVYHRADL